MKILACVLLCVYTVYADSGYADVKYGGYLDLKTPYKGCDYVGQYLKHPSDECKFIRCDYGNEPWKDKYGKIYLFAREMRCANGLSVGYGYTHGYDNPCNTPNKKCMVYPEEHSYKEVDTKKIYDSYDDHNDGYGKHPVHDTYQSFDTHDSYDKHDHGYDKHSNGYDTHNTGYDSHKHNHGYDNKHYPVYDNKHYQGYDKHNRGYDKHSTGYDTHKHNHGYDNKHYQVYDNKHYHGYESHKTGYDTRNTGYYGSEHNKYSDQYKKDY